MKKICIFAAICTVLFLSGCKSDIIPRSYSMFCFDTYITFTLYETDGAHSDAEITDSCKQLLQELENRLSSHFENSLISQINRNAFKQPVKADRDTFELISRCVEISRESDGAFDITLGEISRLWGFSDSDGTADRPDTDKIKALAGKRNYENIILDEDELTVGFAEDGFSLDLGAAAKGWALGKLKDEMLSLGTKSAVIDFGGNIQTIGSAPPEAEHWGVAVSADETNSAIGRLSVNESCISTSNASRRYVEYDGVRYHHIIDGSTGFPAQNDIKSVTVVCDDGLKADALSTAFFVAGSEKAIALCGKYENVYAVITLNDGSIRLSDGAEKIFTQ